MGKDIVPEPAKTSRGAKFKCILCEEATTPEYIKDEGIQGRIGTQLLSVVAEGERGRLYLSPSEQQQLSSKVERPPLCPHGEIAGDRRALWTPIYGFSNFEDLFTNRQLTALTTFCSLVSEVQELVCKDGGSLEYAEAIEVYLSLAISKMANIDNSFVPWSVTRDQAVQLFSRQAIPMVWDFAENNVFNNSAGDFIVSLNGICKVLKSFSSRNRGFAEQHAAQTVNNLQNVMVSTDPPYYDMIGYADLSDFFYIWQRLSLKPIYPDLFKTMLVPKAEELVAIPYRFGGSRRAACEFFENGMLQTFKQINRYACNDIPVTVYYAYKQNETENDTI